MCEVTGSILKVFGGTKLFYSFQAMSYDITKVWY
jgi:hypothetical protein